MKFESKYEILEPVSRGAVETFVARNIASGERVLVHIFECPEQRPDQPTVQWVLESFRTLAPDPAELVLGTGRYSGTSYAYLATKLPDSAALQEWISSYEALQQTEGEAVPPNNSAPDHVGKHGEIRFPETSRTDQATVIPESRQSREAEVVLEKLQLKSPPASERANRLSGRQTDATPLSDTIIEFNVADLRPDEKTHQQEPGEFTREFSGLARLPEEPREGAASGGPIQGAQGEPANQKGPARASGAAVPPPIESPHEKPSSGSESVDPIPPAGKAAGTTDLFQFSPPAASKSTLDVAYDPENDSGSGEFTRFFRGPFHGDRSSQTPEISSASPQPRQQPGEFTEIFGKGNKPSSAPPIARGSSVQETPIGNQGGAHPPLFEAADAGSRANPQHTEILEANRSKFPALGDQPWPREPARTVGPPDSDVPKGATFADGKIWRDVNLAGTSGAEGATRIFSPSLTGSENSSATSKVGPSDFTRIISGGMREPNPEEEPLMSSGSHDDFGAKLAAPPGIASSRPPLPASPPSLQLSSHLPQKPSTPAVAGPAALSPSQLRSAPKPAGAPWTLIVILNGLFVIVVLLVLYFVLKH